MKNQKTPVPPPSTSTPDTTTIVLSNYDGTSIQVTAQTADTAFKLFKKVKEVARKK